MFVLDGAAMVDIEGDRVAKLYPGDWISEESFLTGETTKMMYWLTMLPCWFGAQMTWPV